MASTQVRLHGIPNCDTVKKARAWLGAQGVAHEFIDFKKSVPDEATLRRWLAAVGLQRLVNRQGTTWRGLDDATRAAAEHEAGAVALMQAQPSLIKRPVVQWPEGAITVGFDAADWLGRAGGTRGNRA